MARKVVAFSFGTPRNSPNMGEEDDVEGGVAKKTTFDTCDTSSLGNSASVYSRDVWLSRTHTSSSNISSRQGSQDDYDSVNQGSTLSVSSSTRPKKGILNKKKLERQEREQKSRGGGSLLPMSFYHSSIPSSRSYNRYSFHSNQWTSDKPFDEDSLAPSEAGEEAQAVYDGTTFVGSKRVENPKQTEEFGDSSPASPPSLNRLQSGISIEWTSFEDLYFGKSEEDEDEKRERRKRRQQEKQLQNYHEKQQQQAQAQNQEPYELRREHYLEQKKQEQGERQRQLEKLYNQQMHEQKLQQQQQQQQRLQQQQVMKQQHQHQRQQQLQRQQERERENQSKKDVKDSTARKLFTTSTTTTSASVTPERAQRENLLRPRLEENVETIYDPRMYKDDDDYKNADKYYDTDEYRQYSGKIKVFEDNDDDYEDDSESSNPHELKVDSYIAYTPPRRGGTNGNYNYLKNEDIEESSVPDPTNAKVPSSDMKTTPLCTATQCITTFCSVVCFLIFIALISGTVGYFWNF